MSDEMVARIAALDEALAAGLLSRMGYLLKRMQLADQDAERIIQATPNAQMARLTIQAEEQSQRLPVVTPRRRHWQDN